MSRKHRQFAGEAAEQASQAARVLQQRGQEVKAEQAQAPLEPRPETDAPRPEPRNEPRRLAMQEIEDRHNAVQMQNSVVPEEPETEPKVEPEPKTEVQPETKPEAAPEPQVKTVHVKVDGQEFDVPESEVEAAGGVNAYQRDKASENRLKKANETLADTRRLQMQMAQWAQQQFKPPVVEAPTVAKLLQDNIDTIRWGTPEESSAAFQKVIEAASPKVDPQAIAAYSVYKIQQENAKELFRKEFSDVVADPLVLKLAVVLENERLADLKKVGQMPADWATFYRAIGNEARSVKGRPSQPVVVSTDSTSQPVDKEARKASIVNLPTAAARAALPEAPKPETREDTLNMLRKTRGIPTG